MIPDPAPFLAAHGWQNAELTPFSADWSARRYARLRRIGEPEQAILMQTAPDTDFHAFIRVATILRNLDASAPVIYAVEEKLGMLLLEDFGDRNFGRLIDGGTDAEPLLHRAVVTLAEMQRRYASQVPLASTVRRYDTPAFLDLLSPLLDNFVYPDAPAAHASLTDTWTKLLTPLETQPHSLMLRDFIADNLMDLPTRHGWQAVGILDFELAGIGPVVYDFASLTEQVRRDIPDAVRDRLIAHYLAAHPEIDPTLFRTTLPIMAVHRHLRIFARLQKMNKPDFHQRVHLYLRQLLPHPALHSAQTWCQTFLPQYFA